MKNILQRGIYLGFIKLAGPGPCVKKNTQN
jgi:hypothetical protein